ncbi:MAG TPA: DNA primase [Dehalococcoidia bacterium]
MVVEAVKQRVDIVELIGEYVPLERAGRSYKARCPFHQERTPSFIVSPDRQTWHCFGACGTGGDVFSFVMRMENLDFAGALRLLAQRAGVALEDRRGREAQEERFERLRQANEAAAAFYHHVLLNAAAAAEARAYLERRGLDEETVRAFQLGYSPNEWEALRRHLLERGFSREELVQAGLLQESERGGYDRFRGRLMFPIRDERGRVVGFGGRTLGDETPKYLNTAQSPLFEKGGLLYALDRARDAIRRADQAVIVEGYMDALAAHQHGHANVVASMGTALTERQVALLKRYTRNLVLALDADAAGSEATLRGIQVAAAALDETAIPVPDWRGLVRMQDTLASDIRVLRLPEGKDPDEAIRKDPAGWPALVAAAKPVVDFLFEAVAERLDLSQPRERSRAVDELLPALAAIGDPVVRAHYLQRLARLARVDESVLVERARTLARGRPREGRAAGRGGTAREGREPGRAGARNRHEEYALALLLRYPVELRNAGLTLPDWAFTQTELRRIYEAWSQSLHSGDADPEAVRGLVPEELHESLERILAQRVPPYTAEQAEKALTDCVRRMQQQRLRELAEAKVATWAELQERTSTEEYLQAALDAREREGTSGDWTAEPGDLGGAALDAVRTAAQFYRWMYEQQRSRSVP